MKRWYVKIFAVNTHLGKESTEIVSSLLIEKHSKLLIHDLKSTFGTFLNGFKVAGSKEMKGGCMLALSLSQLHTNSKIS